MIINSSTTQPNWVEIKSFLKQSKENVVGGIAIEALRKTAEILENHWGDVIDLKRKSWPVLHLRPSDVPHWGLPHTIEIQETDVVVISKERLDDESESSTIKFAAHLNKLIPIVRKTIRCEERKNISADAIKQLALRESGMHHTLYDKPEFVHFYHSSEYSAKLKKSPSVIRKIAITLEYCNEKDLCHIDRQLINNIHNVWGLVRNMCEILNRLSEDKLIHRDIKPENLFIVNAEGKLNMKLGDLGFAGKIDDERKRLQRPRELIGGTIDYTAPEILFAVVEKDKPTITDREQMIELLCSERSDVWSMGVVLYEMIIEDRPSFAGKMKLERQESGNFYSQNSVNQFLFDLLIPENCIEVLQNHDLIRNFLFDMIRRMLVIEPKKRISGPDLLKNFLKYTPIAEAAFEK